jgi:hypothetical protein
MLTELQLLWEVITCNWHVLFCYQFYFFNSAEFPWAMTLERNTSTSKLSDVLQSTLYLGPKMILYVYWNLRIVGILSRLQAGQIRNCGSVPDMVLGPTQPPLQWVLGVNQTEHEGDHSLPSSAFMACTETTVPSLILVSLFCKRIVARSESVKIGNLWVGMCVKVIWSKWSLIKRDRGKSWGVLNNIVNL